MARPKMIPVTLPITVAGTRTLTWATRTPSGKLEFYTEAMEAKFRGVGLSALPEFYSEAEQLIDLPHLSFNEDEQFLGLFCQ